MENIAAFDFDLIIETRFPSTPSCLVAHGFSESTITVPNVPGGTTWIQQLSGASGRKVRLAQWADQKRAGESYATAEHGEAHHFAAPVAELAALNRAPTRIDSPSTSANCLVVSRLLRRT
jgi:hypothetical protein